MAKGSRTRKKSKGRKEILPSWNLEDLYASPDDPRIGKVLRSGLKEAKAFRKKYRGKLSKLSTKPSKIQELFAEYESLMERVVKPYHFASLLFAESATEEGRGAFLQKVRTEVTEIQAELLFLEPELLELSTKRLRKLASSKSLSNYKHHLTQLIRSKKHHLPEEQERIFSDLALTGRSAFSRLFDEEFARRKFTFKTRKKTETLNLTDTLDRLYHPDRVRRSGAHKGISDALAEDAPRLTMLYNTLLADKKTRDRYRRLEQPEDSRHLANEIDRESVDAMVSVVRSSYRLVQRFYRFKRQLTGLRELYDYDRYAPIGTRAPRYRWKEAREVVTDTFTGFDQDIGQIVELFFQKKWIDAAERPGKRGGAFCSFITPDSHPYVFMNYSGNIRDVFTLAHELGHAVHAYLMRKQSYLNFDTPLTLAETASVFSELLLFEHLKTKTRSPKKLLGLYVTKIESIIATIHRQTAMFLFERDVHEARQSGELSTEQFNEAWRKRQEEMFGEAVILTPGYDLWWSYIPHFIHSPFYVYAYAFGELLSMSLYAQYQEQGDSFIGKYKTLLESGSIDAPKGLLKPFRINLKKRDFWQSGMNSFKALILEAEQLAKNLE